jgi:hypothetical protein
MSLSGHCIADLDWQDDDCSTGQQDKEACDPRLPGSSHEGVDADDPLRHASAASCTSARSALPQSTRTSMSLRALGGRSRLGVLPVAQTDRGRSAILWAHRAARPVAQAATNFLFCGGSDFGNSKNATYRISMRPTISALVGDLVRNLGHMRSSARRCASDRDFGDPHLEVAWVEAPAARINHLGALLDQSRRGQTCCTVSDLPYLALA